MQKERFKALRAAIKLSQDKVGCRLGLDRTAVSKWERGITVPDQSILPKLAELYNTTIEYLLTGKEPIKPAEPEKPYLIQIYEELSSTGKQMVLSALKAAS